MLNFRALRFWMLWMLFLQPIWYAAASDSAGSAVPLRVGVDISYPPFAYEVPVDGEIGFDRELAEALCRAMNRPCIQLPMLFKQQQEQLRSGEVDFVVAGYARTEERETYTDFSAPYYRSRSIYIGKPGTVISREGLEGKRLVAQKGTVQEAFLRARWGDICEIITERSFNKVLEMLCGGKADVVLAVGLPGYDFLKTDAGQPFMPLPVADPADQLVTTAHIGVRKGAGTLPGDIDKALETLRASGEFNRIMRRYFTINIY